MASRRRKQQRPTSAAIPPTPSSAPYEVFFSETAAKVYARLHRKMAEAEARGEMSSAHRTKFRMVEDVVKKVIPFDPLNKRYGLAGPLPRFFRIKKGRHRICWAASSEKRTVCILFISETLRKAGDVDDPYNVFTKLVLSGEFRDVLAKLGFAAP
jgi:mRNA-degrading endonuclease RelE of RelBE toxin-antitoxin system